MHKTFHKLAIAAILSLSISSSLMANEDLLSLATNEEVATAAAEAITTTEAIKLSDAQMGDVRGGIYQRIYAESTIYQTKGRITEGYAGSNEVYMYATKARQNWTQYKDTNGIVWMAYGTAATR